MIVFTKFIRLVTFLRRTFPSILNCKLQQLEIFMYHYSFKGHIIVPKSLNRKKLLLLSRLDRYSSR